MLMLTLVERCVQINNKKNPRKILVHKRKYEKPVSECKKLHTLIKSMVERNINVLSKKLYDDFQIEYGEIIGSSEISNYDD